MLKRLCYLYKIVSTKQPTKLYDLIPFFQRSLRNKGCIYEPFCRTVCFKFFLPYAIKEWNKLYPEIGNAETYASFRKMLLNFIRPTGNSTNKIYDLLGINLDCSLVLTISQNTNLDITLLTLSIFYVLVL